MSWTTIMLIIEIVGKIVKWWGKNGMLGRPATCQARLDKASDSDLAVLVNLSDAWGNIVILGQAIKDVFVKRTTAGLETNAAVLGTVETVKEWLAKQGESERLLGAVLVDFDEFGDVVKKGSIPADKKGRE